MLTLTPPPSVTDVSVSLRLTSVVIRLAFAYVAEQQGWTRCRCPNEACRCLTIFDSVRDSQPADVLVVRPEAARCQAALAALVSGRARSIVLADDPEALPSVIAALSSRSSLIPERAIELSLTAPRLTERQRETLRLLAAGSSSMGIAAALHESESTAKRDVAELMTLLNASTRAGLVTVAARLGFIESRADASIRCG